MINSDMGNFNLSMCWNCGERVEDTDEYKEFGNFDLGKAHPPCYRKIQEYITHACDALDLMQAGEVHREENKILKDLLLETLITQSADELKLPLNQLDDRKIRNVIESTGLEAALILLRAVTLTTMDEATWQSRLADLEIFLVSEGRTDRKTKKRKREEPTHPI